QVFDVLTYALAELDDLMIDELALASVTPAPSSARVLVTLHQESRLVRADDRPHANLLDEPLPQWLRQLARPVQEIVHRRAREREAAAREILLEAIQRQVVRTLCDREVGEQARPVAPLLDHLRRARRGDDVVAAAAAQHLLHVLVPNEACRYEFVHGGRA